MAAINFTSAVSSVSGANGTLYYFYLGDLNIYKMLDVTMYRDAGTLTWESDEKESYLGIYELLSKATLSTKEQFSSYYVDNILYIFVETSIIDASNRLVLKYKRGFRKAISDNATFDVHDGNLVTLLDFVEDIFASTTGARLNKNTKRRIEDFELSLSEKTYPV